MAFTTEHFAAANKNTIEALLTLANGAQRTWFVAQADPQLARKPVANGVSRQALPDYLRSATITRR